MANIGIFFCAYFFFSREKRKDIREASKRRRFLRNKHFKFKFIAFQKKFLYFLLRYVCFYCIMTV